MPCGRRGQSEKSCIECEGTVYCEGTGYEREAWRGIGTVLQIVANFCTADFTDKLSAGLPDDVKEGVCYRHTVNRFCGLLVFVLSFHVHTIVSSRQISQGFIRLSPLTGSGRF